MARNKKHNIYRISIQWVILALLGYMVLRPIFDKSYLADFEAYCPFGGMQALSSYLVSNSLACTMTATQIFMGLALVAGVFLLSKLFCSYVCPIGTFTEWLGRQGRKLKLNFVVRGWADRTLRILKYGLLFIVFYFSVSSSELFCRTFDPYYAAFTGFGHDVVWSYAIISLLLVIPGSFFVRQFWCKYVCPLSAASNIFTYGFVFLGIIALYLILTLLVGIAISWVWLLAALCLSGFLLESITLKSNWLPLFKVTRESSTCTSCRKCDKACPMAIRIFDQPKVDHIDCHMCGDCITQCPEKDTLKINHRNLRWLPASATLLLIGLGLAFASFTDIPTVSVIWGSSEEMDSAEIYRQSNLKNVKCYGSSMAFVNHMKEVEGVLGAETFVSDKSVKVWYNPAITSAEIIKQAMFTPVKEVITAPSAELIEIASVEIGIDQFFDPGDAGLLFIKAEQTHGILAFETSFGEPVHAVFYFDEQLLSPEKIKSMIEQKKVSWEMANGEETEARTNFKVADVSDIHRLSLIEYLNKVYEPVKLTFNGFDTYTSAQLDTLKLDFHQAAMPGMMDESWSLLSHVSNNRGVVGFETAFTPNGIALWISFVDSMTTGEEIRSIISEPELKVHLSDGTQQEVSNPFNFD
ncbi:MAG: 4Fe-4S binding protein [Lentimicrobium sp.]|jgi:polyferredoxin|nr:4Fe-4S binding protein [Lentimicrobium sp.]MDD2528339.1 4Fe-4S binding protein [Lentimicrobiaceae bacterium]MDD4599085.1 4Fe-4S binding protein [Lentimicrobiaceae bacterium]MDY0025671.1 4Fe-4S binding protein [Lentimicrobium sp.]